MRPSRRLLAATALTLVAACQRDAVAPEAPAVALAPSAVPAHLLGPDESLRTLVDSVDARGNTLMVVEYPAGVRNLPDGTSAYVASVVIRTSIPASTGSSTSGACITNTIDRVETTGGWTASVKKSGGCDREIVVALDQRATGQRAQFSFLYVFGKTRIDYGIVR